MKPLVSDELWAVIEPLVPRRRVSKEGGRPWVDDRAVLTGILFMLRSGVPWRMLPPEMGCGSGVTCWRRLREWQRRGVWKRLHHVGAGPPNGTTATATITAAAGMRAAGGT